jgi:uncharacterized protein YcbK (DUF882 family)
MMPSIARRHFMLGAGASLLSAPFSPALAGLGEVRSLAFDNLHTGEKLSLEYWVEGRYLPDALSALNHLLRDFRTGDTHPISTQLLDLLAVIRGKLGTAAPFSVISGYRSPATNARLRGESEHSGVAAQSLHMQGMAIDIRVPGRPLAGLRDIALNLKSGGVGYYPQSDFVHVDVGRVRRW